MIFGIGLGRTGTTSLTEAIGILGYKTRKYLPLRLLGNIKKYDFVGDMPIQILYRYLDRTFPKSKFILTIRDITSWLESIENFWRKNPSAAGYPENIDLYRNMLYRTTVYDKELLKKSFYRHHKNVFRHFYRNKNFLMMDIISGDAWEILCPFLNKSIPDEPFPHLNASL